MEDKVSFINKLHNTLNQFMDSCKPEYYDDKDEVNRIINSIIFKIIYHYFDSDDRIRDDNKTHSAIVEIPMFSGREPHFVVIGNPFGIRQPSGSIIEPSIILLPSRKQCKDQPIRVIFN